VTYVVNVNVNVNVNFKGVGSALPSGLAGRYGFVGDAVNTSM